MADSKKKNYKDLSYSELVTKRNELKKSYMDLRFQAITGHVENPMQKRTIRREIARTRCGHSTILSPGHDTRLSSSPSGPGEGPVTSVTSCPASTAPRQESRVFSCAPPTIIRVMTWQIFMAAYRLNARFAISLRYCIPCQEILAAAS